MELGMTVLPCGCTMELSVLDGKNMLQMVPCHADCQYLKWTIEQMEHRGKPVAFGEAP